MTTVDEIRQLVMEIRDAIKYDPDAPEMNQTLDALVAVYEAARWFSVHTPVKHIPGLMQQTKYEMLREALAAVDQTSPEG